MPFFKTKTKRELNWEIVELKEKVRLLELTVDQRCENIKHLSEELKIAEEKLKQTEKNCKKQIKSIVKKRDSMYLEGEHTERFYVEFYPIDKEKVYTLASDIIVYSLFLYEPKDDSSFELKKKKLTIYFLEQAYISPGKWSFSHTLPKLQPNVRTLVKTNDGKEYHAVLTDRKVQFTKAELNELKNKQKYLDKLVSKVINDIDILVSEQEKSFPYFSKLLAEYNKNINTKIVDILSSKKRTSPKDIDQINKLTKQLYNLEKKYNELVFQMEFYESKFPELKELRKELKKKK